VSASYEINYETSSSYAETASIATSASFATSASRATSASFATSASRAISSATSTTSTSASYAIVAQQIDVTATKFPSAFPSPLAEGVSVPNWISYTATQPVGIMSLDFAHDITYVTEVIPPYAITSTSTTSITGSLRVKVFPNGDTGSAYYFTFSVPVTASLGPNGDAWLGQGGGF
jgi:hypothetical protein